MHHQDSPPDLEQNHMFTASHWIPGQNRSHAFGGTNSGEKTSSRGRACGLANERAKNPDQKKNAGKTAPHLKNISRTLSIDLGRLR